jgi:hypothetical protein
MSDPGLTLFALRRISQSGENGSAIMVRYASALVSVGLARQEGARCGCCMAIYKLTESGKKLLRELAADDAGN